MYIFMLSLLQWALKKLIYLWSRYIYGCASIKQGQGSSFAYFNVKVLVQNGKHFRMGSATTKKLLHGISSSKVWLSLPVFGNH